MPCVVDEHVHPAEALERRRDESPAVFLDGHVGLHGVDRGSGLAELLESIEPSRRGNDLGACAREDRREPRTQAA